MNQEKIKKEYERWLENATDDKAIVEELKAIADKMHPL